MASSREEVKRLYSLPDDDMRARAQVFLQHGRSYQAQLATSDPDLTTAWFDAYDTAVQAAEAAETVEGRRADGKVKTTGQGLSMKQARRALQDLFFYVRKAYPTSEAQQELFGTDLYDEAAYRVGKMKTLLALAYRATVVPAQQAALTAAGYPAASRLALGALSGELTEAQAAAGLERAGNKVSTETYIELHNVVWNRMSTLSNAAKHAFIDEPALRRSFNLYPSEDAETGGPRPVAPSPN